MTEEQKQYKQNIVARRKYSGMTEQMKEKYMEHRKQYENTREPILNGLTSKYDLELFRQAQARAIEDLVREIVFIISALRASSILSPEFVPWTKLSSNPFSASTIRNQRVF